LANYIKYDWHCYALLECDDRKTGEIETIKYKYEIQIKSQIIQINCQTAYLINFIAKIMTLPHLYVS